MKKIIYIDMDGTLVDFLGGVEAQPSDIQEAYKGHPDDIPGLFGTLKPIPGALEAVRKLYDRLKDEYDLYILSTAPWKNPSAWADKISWIQRYIPDIFTKKVVLCHDKNLLIGDYLIDDRTSHGAETFHGKFIQLGKEPYPDWNAILQYFGVE